MATRIHHILESCFSYRPIQRNEKRNRIGRPVEIRYRNLRILSHIWICIQIRTRAAKRWLRMATPATIAVERRPKTLRQRLWLVEIVSAVIEKLELVSSQSSQRLPSAYRSPPWARIVSRILALCGIRRTRAKGPAVANCPESTCFSDLEFNFSTKLRTRRGDIFLASFITFPPWAIRLGSCDRLRGPILSRSIFELVRVLAIGHGRIVFEAGPGWRDGPAGIWVGEIPAVSFDEIGEVAIKRCLRYVEGEAEDTVRRYKRSPIERLSKGNLQNDVKVHGQVLPFISLLPRISKA